MNSTIKLKNEDKLLLYCARTHIEAPVVEKINKLLLKDLEWAYLIEMASVHSLRSLLYFQLSQVCPENVPSKVMNQLKDHYNLNARRNLLMLGELFKIIKLLELEEITVVPYKGPILAINSYGSLSLREFSDLDIYVDRSDLTKAKKILISWGYETKLNFDPKREAQYLKFQREYKLYNKKKGVLVEIKWYLPLISMSFLNKHAFPKQLRTKSFEYNLQKINVFADEDLLMILSLHAVSHLWGKLSLISDIAELIKSSNGLNWDKIIEESQYLVVERVLYLNLTLASELFDVDLPMSIKKIIESDKKIESLKYDVMKILFGSENSGFLKKVWLRFRIREKKENRIKDFFRIIFIPNSDEWAILQKHLPLIFLLIFTHPIQIFKRAIKFYKED